MYGKPGRLVEDQDVLVFINNRLAEFSQQTFGRLQAVTLSGIDVQWRDSDLIPYLQFVIRFAAFFVDAHLTLSNDAVNASTRHAAELLEQKIIEPLIELRS